MGFKELLSIWALQVLIHVSLTRSVHIININSNIISDILSVIDCRNVTDTNENIAVD